MLIQELQNELIEQMLFVSAQKAAVKEAKKKINDLLAEIEEYKKDN